MAHCRADYTAVAAHGPAKTLTHGRSRALVALSAFGAVALAASVAHSTLGLGADGLAWQLIPKTRFFGHLVVATKGESKVRLHRRAHFAIVGERGALRPLGERDGTRHIGITHPDDRGVVHRQYRLGIKRRMPMGDTDQNDTHMRW